MNVAVIRLSRMCNKGWNFPILLGLKAGSNFLPVSGAPPRIDVSRPFSCSSCLLKDSVASIEIPKKTNPVAQFYKSLSRSGIVHKLSEYSEVWNKMDAAEKEKFTRMAAKRNEELAKQPKWKQQLWSVAKAMKAEDKKDMLKKMIVKKLGKPKRITGHTLFVSRNYTKAVGETKTAKMVSLDEEWLNLPQAERDKYVQTAKQKNAQAYALFEEAVLKNCPELYWEVLPRAMSLFSEAEVLGRKKQRAAKELNAAAEKLGRIRQTSGYNIGAMQSQLDDLNDEIRTLDKNIQAAEVELKRAVKRSRKSSKASNNNEHKDLESAHS